MKRSTDRILTTHVGSLPRPEDLHAMLVARDVGELIDEQAFRRRVQEAVQESVRKQVEVGIDIVDDGELSKPNFANYIHERLNGLESSDPEPYPGPPEDFPEYAASLQAQTRLAPGRRAYKRPMNTGPLSWKSKADLETDIANLKGALAGTDAVEAFMPSVSVSQVLFMIPTTYYKSEQEYLYAIADVLKEEYQAIVDAGFIVQLDAPDVPMMRNRQLWQAPFEDYRKHLAMRLDAVNHALAAIPADRVRFHVCWGNGDGPHNRDVPLKDIIDIVLTVKAGAYSIEAANHRHAHEWEIWETTKLPDGAILIPGVIDSVSTFVEHPDLVAQRLVRFANLVGRENVIAAPDCGFGTFSTTNPRVHPEIMWAKFKSMVEGAQIATKKLWGRH